MESVLERAQRTGSPLVEDGTVTFVWRGDRPPRLIGDFNGFGWREPSIALTESSPGVWVHRMRLPLDAYVEYLYADGDEHMLDPLNARTITNGAGGLNNFFTMPEAEETPLTGTRRGVPRGTVTRHLLAGGHLAVGGQRLVRLYRPPVHEPCPLLVVFDGQDYLRRARLTRIVDNLIAQRRIRPIAMALVDHGKRARFIEYDCSDATIAFLVRHVLPLAQEHLNLLDPADAPGVHGVLGASMGGLISLYTAIRLPDLFGRVASQSGAFGFDLYGRHSVVHDLLRAGPTRPLRIWLDVGQLEWLLAANREMHALLREHDYDVLYREYAGGHNFTSWRNDVWRGLEALFAL